MTALANPTRDLLSPAPEETDALTRLVHGLRLVQDHQTTLVGPDGTRLELPASAFDALKLVVEHLARGETITLVPHGRELTTQEVADILHVSRPHVVKLLEEGTIPHHKVGTHRRIAIEDVLDYRRRRSTQRRKSLAELTRLAEQSPDGYQ